MRRTANKIFKGRQLTIGMDLGDRWSFYCVLDESGESSWKISERGLRSGFAALD
jgi:hypothetical protein